VESGCQARIESAL